MGCLKIISAGKQLSVAVGSAWFEAQRKVTLCSLVSCFGDALTTLLIARKEQKQARNALLPKHRICLETLSVRT